MAKTLTSELFNEKLYDTLPQLYHTQDSMVNYALKRYLGALVDGGYSKVIEETNGILDLNDPNKTPAEVLPIVFEQYGLKIFNGLPEMYLRKLLPILGDLYARKGATTVVEYLTAIISDVKAEVELSDNFLEDYAINLRLEMDYDQNGARDLPDREQLLRIIKEFLPFFISVTVIYVYLFYETGNLKAKDEDTWFHIKEILNDDARIVSHKGSGFFPTLNNLHLGLNNDVVLNETYYYDVDVDWHTDNIITSILETGTFDSAKSHNYFRNVLNNELKTLNGSLILNDFIDSDELVSTDITFSPTLELIRARGLDVLVDTMKDHFEDETTLPSIGITDKGNSAFNIGDTFGNAVFANSDFISKTEEFSDRVITLYHEEATFRSDRSTELMEGVLNNLAVRLNDNLYLNQGVEVDWYEDKVGLTDRASLEGEESRSEVLVIGDEIYYASLNTDYVLNGDLMTNEGHKDIGDLSSEEGVEDLFSVTHNEVGSLDRGYDNQTLTFLNVSACVLNTMLLNNIPEYVKITVNGETTYKYPTMFGLM